MTVSTLNARVAERFAAFTMPAPPSDCILWIGTVCRSGYGTFSVGNKRVGAHRIAYILSHGPIPDGMCVMHSCDLPACVNPKHLSIGTSSENSRDSVKKGRHMETRKRVCKRGHPFNDENTYKRPSGGRRCRACNASDVAAYKIRRRSRG